MAAVATRVAEIRGDKKRIVYATIAFDALYPTGGEAITLNQLGLVVLESLMVFPANGFVFAWDGSVSAPKVLAYWVDTTVDGAAMAEVADTTDISAATAVQCIAIGR